MDKSKIITFILIGNKDDGLERELIEMDCLTGYGNAIILRGSQKFKMLFSNMKDDFEFRLIVHYGLKNDSKSVGKKIETDLKSDFNIPLEFFTRETSIFSETNQLLTLYSIESNHHQIKLYNFDEMNTNSFVDKLPIIKKQTTLKNINFNKVQIIEQKPKIFIGSSTDGLDYAQAVKAVIEDKKVNYDVDIWVDVFGKENSTNIEVLEQAIEVYKFSIFIFSPDDKINMSNSTVEKKIPRDNVIFEYGLFMGKNGRKPNTSFLVPENWKDLQILSDIDGLNRYTYKDNSNKESAVRTACTKIINAIKNN